MEYSARGSNWIQFCSGELTDTFVTKDKFVSDYEGDDNDYDMAMILLLGEINVTMWMITVS